MNSDKCQIFDAANNNLLHRATDDADSIQSTNSVCRFNLPASEDYSCEIDSEMIEMELNNFKDDGENCSSKESDWRNEKSLLVDSRKICSVDNKIIRVENLKSTQVNEEYTYSETSLPQNYYEELPSEKKNNPGIIAEGTSNTEQLNALSANPADRTSRL